jgi:hypothetical protein
MPDARLFNTGNFKETDVVAAATTNIGATTTLFVNITAGAGAVASLGNTTNRLRFCRASAAFTLTNGASLILPGGADIAVASGDTWTAKSDNGGVWRVREYRRGNGKSLVGPAAADITDSTAAGRALLTAASAGAQQTAVLGSQVVGPVGSAGAPGYSFAGDLTSGLRRVGASALAWTAGGADVIANDSSGRVGLAGGTINTSVQVTDEFSGDRVGLYIHPLHATFTGAGLGALYVATNRAANSAFNFARFDAGGGSDPKLRIVGDGSVAADGAYSSAGADTVEMCEWADGNPDGEDRVGLTVVLERGKIRPARKGDKRALIIGAVSATPTVIGDAAPNGWSGRVLRDDFGRPLLEEYEVVSWEEEIEVPRPKGSRRRRMIQRVMVSCAVDALPEGVTPPADAKVERVFREKINPDYDPSRPYASRPERPEWAKIGVSGKLRIRRGQPTGDRWVKMRDVSRSVEEWLVR